MMATRVEEEVDEVVGGTEGEAEAGRVVEMVEVEVRVVEGMGKGRWS